MLCSILLLLVWFYDKQTNSILGSEVNYREHASVLKVFVMLRYLDVLPVSLEVSLKSNVDSSTDAATCNSKMFIV